jgi:predicted nucleic acid-binding protein
VKRLELPRLCFDQLYLSEQVFEEIQTGLLQGQMFYDNLAEQIFPFSETGWLHLTALKSTEEFKLFGQLLLTLHSGEASCLSIAYHRHWAFLTDDKVARQASQARQVPVTGTLGVLLSLVKHQRLSLSEGDVVLQQMIRKNYYSPITSLGQILNNKD